MYIYIYIYQYIIMTKSVIQRHDSVHYIDHLREKQNSDIVKTSIRRKAC